MPPLAVRNGNGNALAVRAPDDPAPTSGPLMTLNDVLVMAEHIARSGLFPVKTTSEAFALLMLAQAENQHPMTAMRRYHVISFGGRATVAMKSDVMQAEFLASGGRINMVERSDVRAAALFSHREYQPEPVLFEYTMEEARLAGDVGKNPNYKTRPKAMLWARMATNGITTICPGVKYGIMSDDEAEDLAYAESPAAQVELQRQTARAAVMAADLAVIGEPPGAPDNRPYHLVVSDAGTAANRQLETGWREQFGADADLPKGVTPLEVHTHLAHRAIQLGLTSGALPSKVKDAINLLTPVYASDRAWVRRELNAYLQDRLEGYHELAAQHRERLEAEQAQDAPEAHEEHEEREPGSDG